MAAMGVVLVDHRRTLRTMGIPLTEAARAFVGLVREAVNHLPVLPEQGLGSNQLESKVPLKES